MIVFFYNSGQLGNRLFLSSYLMVLGIISKRAVVNLSFNEYAPYFEGTRDNPCCVWPSPNRLSFLFKNRKLVNSILYRIYSLSKKYPIIARLGIASIYSVSHNIEEENTDAEEIGVRIKKIKSLIVFYDSPWHWYDSTDYNPYIQEIKSCFTLEQSLKKKADSFITDLKIKNPVVVALHIRLGDYKSFAGGIFYYSLQEYSDFAKAFIKNNALSPLFIIFSDEKIDINAFNGLNILISDNTAVEDIYIMGKCDYIIGPPSTFSSWASFYGNVPLAHMRYSDAQPLKEKFLVMKNRDKKYYES